MISDSIKNVKEIYRCDTSSEQKIKGFDTSIYTGFPSPADDYISKELDLNQKFIKNPSSTFFVRVIGDSMINAGIMSGDILIVDRSLTPTNNSIVLAIIDGEFTVKRFLKRDNKIFLVPDNDKYPEIEIKDYMDFEIWGVVRTIIREIE